jgi:hypothetical protein
MLKSLPCKSGLLQRQERHGLASTREGDTPTAAAAALAALAAEAAAASPQRHSERMEVGLNSNTGTLKVSTLP